MKRVSVYIIMMIILAVIFTSCGSNNIDDKDEDTPIDPVTLVFTTFYEEGAQADAYKEIIDVFEANHKDIKVDLISGAVNYDQKVDDALTKDKDIDIIGLQRSKMIEYINKGYIKDISSWIESQNIRNKYFGVSLGYGKYDNSYYGIGDMPNTVEWYYNVDMFKRLGLSEPKDLDDLIKVSSKLKRYTNMPIAVGVKDQWAINTLFGMITAQTINNDEFNKAVVNNDRQALENMSGADDAVDAISQLVKSGAIHYFMVNYDYSASIDAFVEGRSAILPMGSWAVDKIEKSKPEGFEYKSFEEPVLFVSNPNSMYSATAVQVITVSEKSKHPKEAMEFMDFLFSEKAQKIFAQKNGISGYKSVNTEPDSEVERIALKHLELTDENSTMYIDNVPDKMMDATGSILLQLIDDRLNPAGAWKLIVKQSIS